MPSRGELGTICPVVGTQIQDSELYSSGSVSPAYIWDKETQKTHRHHLLTYNFSLTGAKEPRMHIGSCTLTPIHFLVIFYEPIIISKHKVKDRRNKFPGTCCVASRRWQGAVLTFSVLTFSVIPNFLTSLLSTQSHFRNLIMTRCSSWLPSNH